MWVTEIYRIIKITLFNTRVHAIKVTDMCVFGLEMLHKGTLIE